MMLPAGIVIAAIVVPWYAALYQRDGWTYIASFFVGENIGRYTSGCGDPKLATGNRVLSTDRLQRLLSSCSSPIPAGLLW